MSDGATFGWSLNHVTQQIKGTCWAACVAMLVNYRDGTTYDDYDVCEAAGIDPDAGASDSAWENDLLPQFGLAHVAGRCMTPDDWSELISAGPTIVGISGHVVVCAGVSSDGTEDGTQLFMHDPAVGVPDYWPFTYTSDYWELRAGRQVHMIQLA